MLMLLTALAADAEPLHWSGPIGGKPPISAEAAYDEGDEGRLLVLTYTSGSTWRVAFASHSIPGERRETLSVTAGEQTNGWTLISGDLQMTLPDEGNTVQPERADITWLATQLRRESKAAHRASGGAAWRVDAAKLREILELAQPLGGEVGHPETPPLITTEQSVDLRTTEERACPHSLSEQELPGGKVIRRQPSLLCYREDHDDLGATVFFAVEGSVRQDSWGRYSRMVRQLLVAWGPEDDRWEARFVTDPRADARGVTLWKRDGMEVLEVRNKRMGKVATSRWVLFSKLDGTVMAADEGNPLDVGNARIERLMERMRKAGYRAHRQLEGYIVDSDATPNANPVAMNDQDLEELIDVVSDFVE